MVKRKQQATNSENDLLLVKVKEFGEQLKETRVRLDYTQEDFARHLGVKRQTLSSWEQGVTTPDVRTLLRLKQIAKEKAPVDLGDLLGETRWDSGRTPVSFAIRLLQTIDAMGIRNAYKNRTDALNGFYPVLEKEADSISVVCSSFMGVIRVAPQKVSLLLQHKAKTITWRILMTDPDVSNLREQQEVREKGSIANEIWESVNTITQDWGISKESIRFYRGAPTVFMLFTPERLLLNPYTYQTEAFKTFTLEVARTENSEDIYGQYVTNHFERSWQGPNAVLLKDVVRDGTTRQR
ncbi:MAG: helix-turn-helix domain-containing protein [Acidobacteriia bacterium]|nr:helix-turn-helix domain-containing protein [Terriglobia bacterium]